jgi:glucose-6-phosphate isomerase
MMLLTQQVVWQQLEKHAQRFQCSSPSSLDSPYIMSTPELSLDVHTQRVDSNVLTLLSDLAEVCQVKSALAELFVGAGVNHHKPALHTALRCFDVTAMDTQDPDVHALVTTAREQMRVIAEQVRCGEWLGFSGQPITDVVNIGIGGSQLGPQFCIDALHEITHPHLTFHFVADFDALSFTRVTQKLNPATTLFIVSSKSFTTPETLINAKRAFAWLGSTQAVAQQVIAVTAFPDRASALGIQHVLSIGEWVGGRYSITSAINLVTCIAIGYEAFVEFLQGARAMDEHCMHADVADNLPIMLALLGVWNNNFLGIHHLAILTYAHALQLLVPYLQQLDMESNGKSLDKLGRSVSYATGPIVWGGVGNQGQHSYFQLVCQGTHRMAIEMISLQRPPEDETQRMQYAHQQVLSQGVHLDEQLNGYIPGDIPIAHVQLRDVSPRTLGALVALYEHKVFIQGVIWNINSFDQPGIESFKQRMQELQTIVDLEKLGEFT